MVDETLTKVPDKQIRITSGLLPEDYSQTPLVALLSWEACCKELFRRLHPGVFACSCGSVQRTGHGKTNAGFPVYMCKGCGCTYSLLSGTPFSGTKLGARELVLFMRMWAAAVPAVEIGRQVGLHRTSVLQLQDKLRIYASHGGEQA
jgi:transposase-like protein